MLLKYLDFMSFTPFIYSFSSKFMFKGFFNQLEVLDKF